MNPGPFSLICSLCLTNLIFARSGTMVFDWTACSSEVNNFRQAEMFLRAVTIRKI